MKLWHGEIAEHVPSTWNGDICWSKFFIWLIFDVVVQFFRTSPKQLTMCLLVLSQHTLSRSAYTCWLHSPPPSTSPTAFHKHSDWHQTGFQPGSFAQCGHSRNFQTAVCQCTNGDIPRWTIDCLISYVYQFVVDVKVKSRATVAHRKWRVNSMSATLSETLCKTTDTRLCIAYCVLYDISICMHETEWRMWPSNYTTV